MKTRSRKNVSQENEQDVCCTNIVRRNTRRKVKPESPSRGDSQSVGKRTALREKTNINTSELSSANTSIKGSCRGKLRKSENSTPRRSPKQSLASITPKESPRQREEAKAYSKTPSPKDNSFKREVRERGISKLKSASKDCFVSPKVGVRPSNNSTLTSSSFRRRCVYMNTIPEDKAAKDKEELYEFVVDKNEPPSKRRRKRTVKNRKPVGFPRRRNNSETSCSSASSNFTSFASSDCSSILKPVKNDINKKKDNVVSFCTSISSTCSSIAGTKAPAIGAVNQRPRPILNSSISSKCDPQPLPESFPSIPSPAPVVSVSTRKEDITVPVNQSVNPPSKEFPTVEDSEFNRVANESLSIIPPPEATQNSNPPETPTKNSFGNSSVWSERPSMTLGMANLHSTPCKARSGSDTSSFQQLDETNCNKENCFGFSSDEEEAELNMISPLRLSPNSHAHRHTFLSPPKAPSRYSPHSIKRMMALREDNNLLNVNSSSTNHHKRKLQFQERKKVEPVKKVVRKRTKKAKVDSKENIVSAFKAVQEKASEASSDQQLGTPGHPAESVLKKSLSPISECLFEDLESKEAAAMTIRPPRRSYERPLKKNKKVVGGGLCLVSDDEDDPLVEVEKKDEEVVEEKKKPQPHHPKRKCNAAQKMEKELDQWASLMNMQFGEVEDFDLCVAK